MEATQARPSLHLSKCQIVGNLMPRLINGIVEVEGALFRYVSFSPCHIGFFSI